MVVYYYYRYKRSSICLDYNIYDQLKCKIVRFVFFNHDYNWRCWNVGKIESAMFLLGILIKRLHL